MTRSILVTTRLSCSTDIRRRGLVLVASLIPTIKVSKTGQFSFLFFKTHSPKHRAIRKVPDLRFVAQHVQYFVFFLSFKEP